ncbi:hypothetical protein FRC03_010147 [Tulasnella sp. 419]|nr:hypothetical protein FRC03_010147 [Tulasnella sp. 419]
MDHRVDHLSELDGIKTSKPMSAATSSPSTTSSPPPTSIEASASSSAGPSLSSAPPYVPPKPRQPIRPPKPILKRPPPPPAPFLSFTRNILSISSRFLPPQQQPQQPQQPSSPQLVTPDGGSTDGKPLKRAHFIVPHISTTYPISSQAPPCTPGLSDSIRDIESKELERRLYDGNEGNWSLDRVEEFYRDCCRMRDEPVVPGIIGSLRIAGTFAPRTLDLTGIKLSTFAAATLADTLAIEWGLRRLILKDCDLDDLSLKPILHALLIPRSLPHISIASNKRIKTPAFKFIGVFMKQTETLQFMDLSQIPMDKRAVEYIIGSLEAAPSSVPLISTPSTSTTPITGSPLVNSATLPSDIGTPKPTPLFSNPNPFSSPAPSRNTLLSPGLPASGSSTPTSTAESATGPEDKTQSTTEQTSSATNVPVLHPRAMLRKPSRALSTSSTTPPISPLLTLRLDECGVRGGSLEVLAHAVRPSSLKHLSLRFNRIGSTGAVALALMIKDYPDSVPVTSGPANLLPPGSSPLPPTLGISSPPPTPSGYQSPLPTPPLSASHKPPPRHPLLQNPQHPANQGLGQQTPTVQPTYTPYIPRSKRNIVHVQNPSQAGAVPGKTGPGQVPVITSSRAGGVTTRHQQPNGNSTTNGIKGSGTSTPPMAVVEGHSAALLDKVRSLDTLPRLGALQTLDLKGNDIRNGVTYIAQVLKRNRTLRFLNLAENRVDVHGLVAIAEALKYNSTLETLDLSRNPCCGPSIEGITSIRTALTINTSLKRLFLSGTNMASPGAIALAEFIPEARSLLHLDLTHNSLDMAGVMALSVGLKMNTVIRCLDVNVPPNDSEMARLSREILKCCVRNTERVASGSNGGTEWITGGNSVAGGSLDLLGLGLGSRGGVWGLIEKSQLAKSVKQVAEQERLGEEKKQLGSVGGKEKLHVWKKTPEEVVASAKECREDLRSLLAGVVPPNDGDRVRLLERAQALTGVIIEMVQVEKDPDVLQELLGLNDSLLSLVKKADAASQPLRLVMPNGNSPIASLDSPRIDYKGKGKATPQDELPPDAPFNSSQGGKGESGAIGEGEGVNPSPVVERSRMWVVEEGEIFRKGQLLLGPAEMGDEDAEEGGADVTGDELRKELLEAQVDRPPHRMIEEYNDPDDQHRKEDPEELVRTPR